MVRYQGTRVSGGYAVALVRLMLRPLPETEAVSSADAKEELRRFFDARSLAAEELDVLRIQALTQAGEEFARIFEVHRSILFDEDLEETVEDILRTEHTDAAYAVRRAGEQIGGRFLSMQDPYMRERALDIKDITERLFRILTGAAQQEMPPAGRKWILAADDLTPGDCMRLMSPDLAAIVTRFGSVHSHTAILARAHAVPMITGVEFDDGIDLKTGIVDAQEAVLIVDADDETLAAYKKKVRAEAAVQSALFAAAAREAVTKDGHRIDLYANIAGTKDVSDALNNGACGIGLFRTEYLYLTASSYPSEEEQFLVYREVAQRMEGRRIVIRTLDIGADKRADYFGLPEEHNPALGYRAIRICLDRPDLLLTQLRAILRASAFGRIDVLYPMITSVWEIQKLKALFAEAAESLSKEKTPFSPDVRQGIMIETPAAVMIGEELAKEADFFSIGTNDLTQYLLACDRQNPLLSAYYDPHHPALLSAIRMIVSHAKRAQIPVSVCGEIAADTSLTAFFLALDVDELSMNPSGIPAVKDAVRSVDLSR